MSYTTTRKEYILHWDISLHPNLRNKIHNFLLTLCLQKVSPEYPLSTLPQSLQLLSMGYRNFNFLSIRKSYSSLVSQFQRVTFSTGTCRKAVNFICYNYILCPVNLTFKFCKLNFSSFSFNLFEHSMFLVIINTCFNPLLFL